MESYTTDRNGNPFGMGVLCWDDEAKETVKITNGQCTLDHSSSEAFRASHGDDGMASCHYAPSEAIAVRVVGWHETKKGPRPAIAYTYRKVRPEALTVLAFVGPEFAAKAARSFPWPQGAQYTNGRV